VAAPSLALRRSYVRAGCPDEHLLVEQVFDTIGEVRSGADVGTKSGGGNQGTETLALARTALATSRVLPVVDPLVALLPDGALVRGRAVSCGGAASMSLALALAVQATASGSWLAVVDVASFGLEAAEEFGIPLERVVRVDPPHRKAMGEAWAEVMGAVLDGFEVVVTQVPQRLNAGLARRVQARLKAREAVMIALGRPGPFAVDTDLQATDPQWEGVADGWGCLRGRRVGVTASGRRVPRPRRATLWLPGPDGRVATVEPFDRTERLDRTEPSDRFDRSDRFDDAGLAAAAGDVLSAAG